MSDINRDPTLANALRKIADALERGEISHREVSVHWGTAVRSPGHHGLGIHIENTNERAISIVLRGFISRPEWSDIAEPGALEAPVKRLK